MLKPILTTMLASALLACASPPGPDVSAHDGWARETGASDMAAAYVTIANRGAADRLTGVRTEIGDATLHETSMEDGVMRMRAIDPGEGLVVPSNGKLTLAPGGAHVMIMGLKAPLKAGEQFSLTLQFERSRPERVEIQVRPAAGGGQAQ